MLFAILAVITDYFLSSFKRFMFLYRVMWEQFIHLYRLGLFLWLICFREASVRLFLMPCFRMVWQTFSL